MLFAEDRITPKAQGYRLPAEWELHQATWLSWPHNPETWPGRLETVERAMTAWVRALAESELVYINVLDEEHGRRVWAQLEAEGIRPERVRLEIVPTNDAWCRDHGAIFVSRMEKGTPEIAAVDCGFNAWGGKYPPWDLDDAVPRHMAQILGVPRFAAGMILEGGSIDVSGAGTLITTEQCLLNPNRNPDLSRDAIEKRLAELFTIERVVWLGEGIVGDDTDGHVDDIARFVTRDMVVAAVEENPKDPNYQPLRMNRERLRHARLADGGSLEVIEIPMPTPVFHNGERLPASYANFYIANRVVLIPVFGCPQDELALKRLESCFSGRALVPVDCRDVVLGLGAVHCLTQQVPAVSVGQ